MGNDTVDILSTTKSMINDLSNSSELLVNTTVPPQDTATIVGVNFNKIFLQTTVAQGIAGFFTFAALFITCYQVSVFCENFVHGLIMNNKAYIKMILTQINLWLIIQTIFCLCLYI